MIEREKQLKGMLIKDRINTNQNSVLIRAHDINHTIEGEGDSGKKSYVSELTNFLDATHVTVYGCQRRRNVFIYSS